MRKGILTGLVFSFILFLPTAGEVIDGAFAVTMEGKEKAFFFNEDEYRSYDFDSGSSDPGYPRDVDSSSWPGVTFSEIDAVLNWGNGKAYFFSGNRYIRYDLSRDRADSGYPRYISYSTWPGLYFTSVDAAVNAGNGKAYFFSGTKYMRYDIASDKGDFSAPRDIALGWKNFPFRSIDAALSQGAQIHFFSGNKYISYNLDSGNPVQETPESITEWAGISDLTAGESGPAPSAPSPVPQAPPHQTGEPDGSGLSVKGWEITVSPPVVLQNTVLGKAGIIALRTGSYMLTYQNRDTVYFIELDESFQRTGFEKEYAGYWFSEFIPAAGGGFYFALGKDVDNTYITGYPNTLYVGKMDSDGEEEYFTYIFGGTGHEPGDAWFDGRSTAELTEGDSELGIYFEVQKNWADPGEEEDVHNGDMFAVLDSRGRLMEERNHFWTASHSSTIQTAYGSDGNFYTMTIGDAYPYGLQYYNRNRDRNWLLWPPEEDYIPYEKVNSTNAAGILEEMLAVEDGFIAVMGTLEHPNIGVFDKVDVLFLRTDFSGKVVEQSWLTRTPQKNESVISIVPWGDDYLAAWGKGNDYDDNWEPGRITLSVIDGFGTALVPPEELDSPFGTYSQLTPGLNNSALWVLTENRSDKIQIFQVSRE